MIRSFLESKMEEDEFSKAGIGTQQAYQVDTSIRGDFVYWLDLPRDEEMRPFFMLAEEVVRNLNRLCFLSLSGFEFHLAHYPSGAFYKRHVDQFRERRNRLISVVIYLNDNWQPGDGGELKIFQPEDREVRVEPIARRCVMFKSDVVEHEVAETRVSRYSLTGWLLYNPPGLGYL